MINFICGLFIGSFITFLMFCLIVGANYKEDGEEE